MKTRAERKSARLHVIPCELAEANAFVKQHHRHHGPAQGHRFSIAVCTDDEVVRGVAIVGRPTGRFLDDGWTLEVTRLATDGTANACSALYGAARRAGFALGYRRLVTFVLDTESGGSLLAGGWKCMGKAGDPRGWNKPSRPRVDKAPRQMKFRWEAANERAEPSPDDADQPAGADADVPLPGRRETGPA